MRSRAPSPAAPRHVAIIMDGNGRWAARNRLPRLAGHRAGIESVRDVVRACGEAGVSFLTLYAFSTENWRRPRGEVSGLMELLRHFLRAEVDELNANRVRLRTIGDVDLLPAAVRRELDLAQQATRRNRGLTLVLALNYSGRREIARAAEQLVADARAGRVGRRFDAGRELPRRFYAPDLPDPDLLIRTSGEMRLSNFLLWQLAYTELYVTPVYWPEFRRAHLFQAFAAFAKRERRFGGVVSAARGRR